MKIMDPIIIKNIFTKPLINPSILLHEEGVTVSHPVPVVQVVVVVSFGVQPFIIIRS